MNPTGADASAGGRPRPAARAAAAVGCRLSVATRPIDEATTTWTMTAPVERSARLQPGVRAELGFVATVSCATPDAPLPLVDGPSIAASIAAVAEDGPPDAAARTLVRVGWLDGDAVMAPDDAWIRDGERASLRATTAFGVGRTSGTPCVHRAVLGLEADAGTQVDVRVEASLGWRAGPGVGCRIFLGEA